MSPIETFETLMFIGRAKTGRRVYREVPADLAVTRAVDALEVEPTIAELGLSREQLERYCRIAMGAAAVKGGGAL